jgi:glycosyltransferase involved in cell wall biosynthesis
VPLHVLYTFPLRLGVPGIGMTAWHQVRGLVQLGVKITLCCGTCERPLPGVHSLVETMKLARVRIPYRLMGFMRAIRRHDAAVARLLPIKSSEIDLVHGWPLGSLATFKAARKLKIACVLERQNAHTAFACETVAAEHVRLGLPLDRENTHAVKPHRLELEEAEYCLASKLACPSDFVAKTFLDRGFASTQIARHQYGYDPTQFNPTGATRGDRRFTAVFVGRCEPRKGLHYALEAWHASGAAENGRFIICGSFIPGYRELIAPLLKHASIEERGFVADVASVLRTADVLVLPSIEEGSALVTYEARGAGCVVLASNAAGAVGADGDELLLHDARDVATLARQMKDLSSNRSLLEQIRQRSLSKTSTLTWDHAAQVLLHQYHCTMGEVTPAVLARNGS